MRQLSEHFHESCSAAILEGNGDRLCRALSGGPHHVGDARDRHAPAGVPHFARTCAARLSRRRGILVPAEIPAHRGLHAIDHHRRAGAFERVREDRAQGFSIVDEELERGLRSIAVPIVDRAGKRSPRSMSAPTPPERRATRCATASCRACAPSPSKCPLRSPGAWRPADRCKQGAREGCRSACTTHQNVKLT